MVAKYGLKLVLLSIATLLLGIQYEVWLGSGGVLRVMQLKGLIAQQSHLNSQQQQVNLRLKQHIQALRSDPQAIAALARSELGMIKSKEVLYRIVV